MAEDPTTVSVDVNFDEHLAHALVEARMREHFGRNLDDMTTDPAFDAPLRAYREGDWLTEARRVVASPEVQTVLEAMRAGTWDQGYAFWYDNDIPPEHRDYGKGNPYRKNRLTTSGGGS